MTARKKTKFMNVRLTPETHAAAQKVAEATNRTMAGLVEYTLRYYIDTHWPDAHTNKALRHRFVEGAAANGE